LYLRALKIRGFKSFARKTIFEFEPGVTIIVGPNGSGKSNVADALMWVLGEQSPTSLRGNRMEDVIFSGSMSLKPVNIAEVALTLDNSNGDFPLDYSEITISRNVVRGGDSEYRLNNTTCRLTDIQELLSDAGVGRTLNSVISQGQLDEVLSCGSEDRRDYIEEAGGLLKFRRRREKAVRRMDRMEDELVRTKDILREVRRQLRPLKHQAGKLERYQELTREISEARLALDVASLRVLKEEWDQHQEVQSERKDILKALEGDLASKARLAVGLEEGEVAWRAREQESREGLYRLVSIHERLKAMYSVWDDRREREKSHAAARGQATAAEVEVANREMEERGNGLKARAEELDSLRSGLEDEITRLNGRMNEITREVVGLETRLEVYAASRGERGDRGGRRRRSREEELRKLAGERERIISEVARLEETAGMRQSLVSSLEKELGEARERREASLECRREFEREEARLVTTLELMWRLDGKVQGVENTTSALLSEDPTGGGLGGMLVDNMEIEPPYEAGIMGYLGPWAYGLAARDTSAIKVAIKYLKDKEMGQSLFFRPAREGAAVDTETGPAPEGTRRARDVVSASGVFGNALDTLLADVFLAPGVDVAFELARGHPNLVFICPDGDMISGGTLIKGGSLTVSRAHLDATRRRREDLEGSLAECRTSLEDVLLGIRAQDTGVQEAVDKLAQHRSDLDDARTELAEKRTLLASSNARADSMEDEVEHLDHGRPDDFSGGIDPSEFEARIVRLKDEEEKVNVGLGDAETKRREVAGEARFVEGELAALQKALEIGRQAVAPLRPGGGEGSGERRDGAGTLTGEQADRLSELHRSLMTRVKRRLESVREEIDRGTAGDREASIKLRTLREEIAERQREHDALREQIHGDDLSRAELNVRVEQLALKIVEGHKVPLEFAFKQHPVELSAEELEGKVEKLAAELEQIGPVNPEAIVEREALEERHDFLAEQLEDIKKARTELLKVVSRVDREIKERFKKTVEEVDRHFREIFASLFPNGRAELRLTDPEDLMNTGVEIMAQPEGKKLRRISLLSGGETSLTAIAFFFALFKVRPSPFYFLDEVEAALDDPNLHRFLQLVKEFREESQLILITHQKRSMEIADLLYGVTMQDDGMSRVVSQKAAG
jgi:chromosome segregation protein